MAKQTTKQKKQTQIAIGILVGILIIALVWKLRKPQAEDLDKEISSPGSSSSGTKSTSGGGLKQVGANTTLSKGTKAKEVQWAQYYYNKEMATPLGKTKLAEDGVFGSKTEAVFQTVLAKKSGTWNEFKGAIDSANNPAVKDSLVNSSYYLTPYQFPYQ